MFNKMVSDEMTALLAELAALQAEGKYLEASIPEAKGAQHVRNLKLMSKA